MRQGRRLIFDVAECIQIVFVAFSIGLTGARHGGTESREESIHLGTCVIGSSGNKRVGIGFFGRTVHPFGIAAHYLHAVENVFLN